MNEDDIRHIDPDCHNDEGEEGGDDAGQGDPRHRDRVTKLVMRPGDKLS